MGESFYEKWAKISEEMNKKLAILDILDEERDSLIQESELTFSEELCMKMNENIRKYQAVLQEIKQLNASARKLHSEMD